jgi:hypothetical protein
MGIGWTRSPTQITNIACDGFTSCGQEINLFPLAKAEKIFDPAGIGIKGVRCETK